MGRDFGFIVAAGLLWFGAYNLALNKAERHVDAGTASMLVNTGPIFLGIFAGGKLGWIAYLGVFPTAIGFTTWAYALNRTNTGRLGATTYLVPPVVIAMARVLLGEAPPLHAIPGGAICIAGVVVVRTPNLGRLRRASTT